MPPTPANRAAAIRRRRPQRLSRNHRSVKPLSTRGSGRGRSVGAPAIPPVLMRGSEMGVPLRALRGRQRARRRYDIALATPGAEIRLPSLPMVRFGWRLVSGLLMIVLSFALFTLWNSPLYRVKTAEVEGLERLTDLQINAVLGVAGKPVFALEPPAMRRQLQQAFPQLAKVSVEVGIPATVRLNVIERQPVLAWKQGDHVLWVDAEGISFPQGEEDTPPILVEAESAPPGSSDPAALAANAEPMRFLPAQLVTAIFTISTRAPENTPLTYNRERGLGWKDGRGWVVYFGLNVAEMEMKLRVYDAMLKYLAENQIQPALISVESVHAPYFRLER